MRAPVFAVSVPRLAVFLFLFLIGGVLNGGVQSQGSAQTQDRQNIVVTDVRGAIGVATALHVCGLLVEAAKSDVGLVVLRIDTPGGLLSSTRDLIHCILASSKPVAAYVEPSGSRAASAGTYIVQAAHIAAMAPSTHIGAATPIAIGLTGPNRPAKEKSDKSDSPSHPGLEEKTVNDAVAYLKSLAELRGRNTTWAEKAVTEAATLTASEALRQSVIDIIADDMNDLLRQIDGRTVTISGKKTVLATAGATYRVVAPNWRLRFLAAISDPNIAFIFMLVGIYGILFEMWSPGAVMPGVIGGISLLLGLIALSVLPVSYGALALMLLGIALMTGEGFMPGFGILGLGGLVAFVVGAIFLFDPVDTSFDFRVAWPVIAGGAAASILISSIALASVLRARRIKPVSGAEHMIGANGNVIHWQDQGGTVRVHGEVWRARGDATLSPGADVRVVDRDGLTLIVAACSLNARRVS